MDLAQRVVEARRSAGLTQRELAVRLGQRLWDVEMIERGQKDAAPHVDAIAEATSKPAWWFGNGAVERAQVHQPAEADVPRPRWTSPVGPTLILGSITLLVVIRLFTEVIHVLPRSIQFIDVPLLILLLFAAWTTIPREARKPSSAPFIALGGLFLLIASVSVIANPSRVAVAPVLMFVYGFLAPLAFYFAASRLWVPGNTRMASRVLIGLGLLQFAVVLLVDLPRWAVRHNPDVISGTFGDNPYQLVFYLLVFATLVCGIATFEKERRTARLAPVLIGATFLVIFLAQYRALLVATALTVVLVGFLLTAGRTRGVWVAAALIGAFVISLGYVATRYPVTKFAPTVDAIRTEPTFFIEKRLSPIRQVLDLYGDQPHFGLIGTGPGTYSSRAWKTFAGVGDPASAEGAEVGFATALAGGRAYRTDVSDRYVAPKITSGEIIQGSRLVASPLSSVASLLAEVGLFGFVVLAGIYGVGFWRAVRLTLAGRKADHRGRSVTPLALGATVAFFVLFQMAFLENWLEVVRITAIAWILLAIAEREVEAKPHPGSA